MAGCCSSQETTEFEVQYHPGSDIKSKNMTNAGVEDPNVASEKNSHLLKKAKVVVWREEDKALKLVCEEHYGLLGRESETEGNKVLTVSCKGYIICLKDEKDKGRWEVKEHVDQACFERGMDELRKQVDIVDHSGH